MNNPTTTPANTPKTSAPNPKRLALLGFLLTLLGGLSYVLLLDVPWIRATAIPNVALTVLGLALSLYALLRTRAALVVIAAVASLLVGGGFLASVFILMDLPAPAHSWTGGRPVPDFELPNQNGERVRLSSFVGRGPVLLVFYRGHW